MSGPEPHPASPAGEMLRQAKRLQQSAPYHTKGHPDHERVGNLVRQMFARVYGNGPLHPPEAVGAGGRDPFAR